MADPLKPRGDVDAIAHQVAVALLDDVAEMNADAELDALLGRHADVALDQRVLNCDRAAHRFDHAAELDEASIAGALEDAAVMGGYRGVDEIGAQAPETRERAILVRSRDPAEADDVGDQDRRDLRVSLTPPAARLAQASNSGGRLGA